MTTLDTAAAAAAEIERLNVVIIDLQCSLDDYSKARYRLFADVERLTSALEESERQRKILAEQLERLGRAGIEAAVGAGK